MSRHGHTVEASTISAINETDSGYSIDRQDGWGTMFVSKSECNGFIPQVGDTIILFTRNFSLVVGIIIENHVIRYKTADQVDREHQEMIDGFRLRKLEEYVKNGEELRERVTKLHPKLRQRMERFVAEAQDPVEFWIESAPYEMACLEGANALLNKVNNIMVRQYPEGEGDDFQRPLTPEEAVKWIRDWWSINSDEHDPPYDYKKQMELVPDFGEGHSGFTASAAKEMAIMVLRNEKV